jgi:hypothetical protein
MLVTATEPRPARIASATSIHQLYVTHCLYDEGVKRKAGFGVRAASTLDPLLLRFAAEYPSYEVPADWPVDQLATAPRRLAFVRLPGGRYAMLHSAAISEQERGRPNNFFTHVIVPPSCRAWQALASWAAPEWATEYPVEGDKQLPALDALPRGKAIHDEAVTAFLQRKFDSAGELPETRICPERLASQPQKRRELLAMALRGVQLVLQQGRAAPRARLYILAEPGLVALLIYAAARLLPEALAADLTFSTYESAQLSLHLQRQVQVLGTWFTDPSMGFSEDYYTKRGYAIDTFNHRFSPELVAASEPVLDEWVKLASQGDWPTVDKVHSLLGQGSTSVVSFKEGFQAAKLARRLASGQASPADLLALKQSSLGEPILQQHRDRLWPTVREGFLNEPRLVDEFADLVREHIPDLEEQARQAFKAGSQEAWRPHTALLWSVLKHDPTAMAQTFQRLLPEPPYAPARRFALLQELHALGLEQAELQLPLHPLVRDCSLEELEELARAEFPREWYVWAVCYALVRQETRSTAVKHLHGCDDRIFQTFWDQFQHLTDEGQRRAILAPLFDPALPTRVAFFSRMLKHHCYLPHSTLSWLLGELGAWRRDWAEFWGREDHLGCVLDILRRQSEEATPTWERLCGKITAHVLPPSNPFQQTLLLNLAAVKDRPGQPLPEQAAQTIADWVLLRDHFEKAAAVPSSEQSSILDACARRRLDPIGLLATYFQRFVEPHGQKPAVLDDFAGFFHSFYTEPTTRQDYGSRLIGWLQVVGDAPDEALVSYQLYYLERWVPEEFRWHLAEEMREAGKLLPSSSEAIPKLTSDRSIEFDSSAATVFSFTGLRTPEALGTKQVWARAPWLLLGVGGGLLAALPIQLLAPKSQVLPIVAAFLPLVLILSESATLQALALAASGKRGRPLDSKGLIKQTASAAIGILPLGGGLAVFALLGAPLFGASGRVALCLAASIACGMAAGAAAGYATLTWVRQRRLETWLPSGPIARTFGLVAATAIYFALARLLL